MGEDGKIVYKVVIDDKGVQTEAEQAGQRAGDSFGKGAGVMEQVWIGAARRIGEAFTNVALNAAKAAGKLLTGSIQTGMDFDAAMSQVAATLGYTTEQLNDSTTQQAQDFQALRDFALEMGKTTAFTAQQSAEALNYMALAGYDAETSMRMLPTVLNLAAAGGMDLARASDAVTDIQSAFGLTIEETVALVDQMAKTSQRTNTSVSQLSEAMLTVGGAASYMRGGTAEVAEVLGIMASAGIKGAEGGTHLRNMLLRLAAPTEKGAQALEDVGVAIFDAEGKMRSFAEIMPELNKALSGLTDEEKLNFFDTVFNVRDIAAANALLGASVDTWERLGDEIRNSEGAAQDMAHVQLDNLKGDVTLLKSAWEGYKIELASKFAPVLRQIMPQLLRMIELATERLSDVDWGNVGNQILNIADRLLTVLEYFINNSDKIIDVAGTVLKFFGISDLPFTFRGTTAENQAAQEEAQKREYAAAALEYAQITARMNAADAAFERGDMEDPAAAYYRNHYMGSQIAWQADQSRLNALEAQYGEFLSNLTDADMQGLSAVASDASNWGEDMIKNYSEGVAGAAASYLEPAISAAATLISRYLHHSEPDTGPMADDSEWMPDMMQGWARQIRDYAPELSGALSLALPTRADFERSVSVNIAARGNIGARAIENTIVLNGREIARATAWDMGEQLAWEEL